jgi:diguanylate cyclase (GGDEF)-like protein
MEPFEGMSSEDQAKSAAQAMDWMRVIIDSGSTLYQCDDPTKLLSRFLDLLAHHFHLNQFFFFRLTLEATGQLKVASFENPPIARHAHVVLAEHQTQLFVEQLSLLDLRHVEYWQGYNNMVVGSLSVCFFVIGQTAQEGIIIGWEDGQNLLKSLAVAAPLRVREVALDMLIKQMQGVYRWATQLAGTQALIYRDDLTGLYNYRYLDVALDTEIRRAQRFQSSFCLLFIDLDNFKPINDTYGHLSGSMVLKQVANILMEELREIDSIFRYGGDEYVVLLLGASSTAGYLAGERIRMRIEGHSFHTEAGEKVKITASIGVAAYPDHGIHKQSLLHLADQCMYRSKKAGKNCVMVLEQAGEARNRRDVV